MTAPKNNPDLTSERLRELLDYDPQTGVFTNLISRGPRAMAGMPTGVVSRRRVQITIDYAIYMAHRLAWLYVYGRWPTYQIDHIDGDSMNNRIANLRDVSQLVNSQNRRRPRVNSTYGFLGVSMAKHNATNPWVTHIRWEGKVRHIGYFSTPELAYAAYVDAKRRLHVGNTL